MKPPSFNAYPNNWLGSGRVSAMLPEQEGAYFRLLCYQWNSENQTIPDSDEDLAMLSRLNGRWATLGAKVRACFDQVAGGGLRNERLWHEYTRIMGLRERQAAGGKKAMGNRWNKPQDSTKQPISRLEDSYNREQRTENRETGMGNGTENTIPPPVGSVCPGHVPDAPKTDPSLKPPRPRNPALDALAACDGPVAEISKAGWKRVATALAEIREVSLDVHASEIERRARNYRLHFAGASLTSTALAKHWAKCWAAPSAQPPASSQRPKWQQNIDADVERKETP